MSRRLVPSSRPLRVLHVVRGLQNSSGTTHIVGPLAEEQARQGAQVQIYFVDQGEGPPLLPDPQQVTTRRFRQACPIGHHDHPGLSVDFARAVRGTLASFDVAHIHAVWNFPTFYTMRTARRLAVPYMVAPQGSLDPWAMHRVGGLKALYTSLAEIPLMRCAARMHAVSRTEALQFARQGIAARSVVIPNGIHLEQFNRPQRRLIHRLGLDDDTHTVLSLSRLHPKKGIDILIRAFAQLPPETPRCALVVAGSDHGTGYEAELRQLVSASGLGDRVHFIGELRGQEKLEVLVGADIFVLASHSEGLPVACIEAMAAGLPVVITPECNIPEVREAGAGLLVGQDPAQICNALQQLLTDAGRRHAMGQCGRRLVEERFTWNQIAQQTLAVYHEMIAEHRAGMAQPT